MNIAAALLEDAKQIATNVQNSAKAHEAELLEIQKQKLAVQAKLDTAQAAAHRLLNFQVKTGVDYQCPRCWIIDESRSRMEGSAGDDRGDIMRCTSCNHDVYLPFDR